MSEGARIEPVPWAKRRSAVAFVGGGAARDEIAELRSRMLRRLVEGRGPQQTRLWWARRGERCTAAAVVLESTGRTGMLFQPPGGAPGVDAAMQMAVTGGVARAALAGGLSLVQSLIEEQDRQDAALLQRVGFFRLARLLYLRRQFTGAETIIDDARLSWRSYGQFSEAELGALIARTYERSLDCPALEGVRRIEDVIAGHKACGKFCPAMWWIVQRAGSPAGCVLVNETPTDGAEIIYLGVVVEHRGHGLGRALVAWTLAEARRRGRTAMDVVVDDANVYARRLYDAAGFQQRSTRVAYALLQTM